MRNSIILMLVVCLFGSCSKGVKYLYRIENRELARKLDSIEPCQGLYDLISENVFYDNQDSIFLINDGIWSFLKDYEPCIDKLNDSLLVNLLGAPDSIGGAGLPLYACYKAKIPSMDGFFYGMGLWGETSFVEEHYQLRSLSERNFLCKKEKKWVRNINFSSFKYNRAENQVVGLSWECRNTRNKAYKLSYKKKGSNRHFINMCELRFTGYLCNHDLTFTKSEMQNIFGKPDLISNDTLFYQTIATPFNNISGSFPNYKGKVFCSIFVKNITGGFAYMNGLFVEPKRIN